MRWPSAITSLLSRAVADLDPDRAAEPPDDERPPLLTIGLDGWLVGDGVEHVPTRRAGYRWRTRSQMPGGILWHWTSTQHGTGRAMARRIVDGSGSSVHLWIEGDGTLIQSAPFSRGTGHAGGSSSARLVERDNMITVGDSGYSANSYLLGVELVNVGEVRSVGGAWLGWPFGRGPEKSPRVASSEVRQAEDATRRERCYHAYTDAQVVAAERLIRACRQRYAWRYPQAYSWGHCSVDPTRKTDPGPLWLVGVLPELLARTAAD